ncbi:class I SAM-dependent methyltransferase [Xanthomonas phaseoli]|uniref:class I SAM-dependent methyltransferase n=1 Tax=Xanthomonas phaseoli TaxID=1985254 RepID=UPI001E28C0F6|nr:class I SAM-dependent methyltransferase [Xanthomonas phaseoli]MCC8471923.1 class I SAM-dependent methyltransferase [Xanthomonas phaseoli]
MSETFIARLQELAKSARILALVGASIKLRSNDSVDSAIRAQIEEGARMALGEALDVADEEQLAFALTMIEMALSEAMELFRNPDRGSNWEVVDVPALQAAGRASKSVFTRIQSIAETRPRMRKTFSGTFLDVGTGVAGIALEAARTCSDIRVDGIDIWEPALELARQNVAESPYANRVSVRNLDVSMLEEEKRYSLAWLPTMFLKRPIVEAALDRIARASVADAYLVAALYSRPNDPFLALMASLRTLRSGGEISDPAEIRAMMEARGYVDVEMSATPVATFVFGRRP